MQDKRDAQTLMRAYRTQLAKGEVGIEAKKSAPVFSQAVKDFLAFSKSEHAAHPNTHQRYVTSCQALLRYFGDTPLERITKDDVEGFKSSRVKQRKRPPGKPPAKAKAKPRPASVKLIKSAMVNRELACLKALFNCYVKDDVLVKNPVSRVKFLAEPGEHTRVLSEDEERLYLLAASQPLQDVAALMVETGARPEEICRLQRAQINLAQGYVSIPFGKTKAARRKLPLSARSRAVIERRLTEAKGDYLFAGGRGGDDIKNPVVKLNAAHNGAVKRSAVTRFRLYDLRHTFATRAAEAGVDLVTLAAMLGHSRVQMVLRLRAPDGRTSI